MPKIYVKNRDKLILCGLFLAKFDRVGYEALGFSSFSEAFSQLGLALGGKGANIKNYRDEFDPYFENARQGWASRALRPYTAELLEKYKDLDFRAFADLISGFLDPHFQLQKGVDKLLGLAPDEGFIKRTATGLAAEHYFLNAHRQNNFHPNFTDYALRDTRALGCGFDFHLVAGGEFLCVEVKGLSAKSGSFILTAKEHAAAQKLGEQFCLYLVSNLAESPAPHSFFDPLAHFDFERKSSEQSFYQARF